MIFYTMNEERHMKSLVDATPGLHEIKWMFGDKESIHLLKQLDIHEGSILNVLYQYHTYVIVAFQNHRFVLEDEIARGIKI